MGNLYIRIYYYTGSFISPGEMKLKYSGVYEGNIDIIKIENNLYSLLGERIKAKITHNNEIYFLDIELFENQEINKLLEYLENYKIIKENIEFDNYESFSNTDFNYYIQVEEISDGLDYERDLKNIRKILDDNGIKYKIFFEDTIIENGASGYFQNFLLAIGSGVVSGVVVEIIKEIYQKLKSKYNSNLKDVEINFENYQKIRNIIVDQYNLNSKKVTLIKIEKEDNNIILKYNTKKGEIFVKLDGRGEIIKYELKNN